MDYHDVVVNPPLRFSHGARSILGIYNLMLILLTTLFPCQIGSEKEIRTTRSPEQGPERRNQDSEPSRFANSQGNLEEIRTANCSDSEI